MNRTLDKRLDALAPPALDVLVQRLYAAMTASWRRLTLRELCELGMAAPDVPAPLDGRLTACDQAAGVFPLKAQCLALIDEATLSERINAIQDAEAKADAEPLHPVSRLYRRFSEAELDRLVATPNFYAGLLELAPAYIDVDRPMGEQGL